MYPEKNSTRPKAYAKNKRKYAEDGSNEAEKRSYSKGRKDVSARKGAALLPSRCGNTAVNLVWTGRINKPSNKRYQNEGKEANQNQLQGEKIHFTKKKSYNGDGVRHGGKDYCKEVNSPKKPHQDG